MQHVFCKVFSKLKLQVQRNNCWQNQSGAGTPGCKMHSLNLNTNREAKTIVHPGPYGHALTTTVLCSIRNWNAALVLDWWWRGDQSTYAWHSPASGACAEGEPLHIASECSLGPSSFSRQPRGSLLAALRFIINYKVGNKTDQRQRVTLFAHGRRWMIQ